jgi:cytochrome P450
MAEATTDPVRLPPAPRIPKVLQGAGFFTNRYKAVAAMGRRYGSEFTLNLPMFGKAVVISDPALIKELFTMNSDLVARAGNLGEVLGPGSTFSLEGMEHRQRRKLLVPPFHGKRMQGYEHIIEEEVLREIATWREGEQFATLPSMMRITLNAILRAVFGAEGEAFEELRELLPAMVLRASKLAVLPPVARRDYGPLSPWGRVERMRTRHNAIVARLIGNPPGSVTRSHEGYAAFSPETSHPPDSQFSPA